MPLIFVHRYTSTGTSTPLLLNSDVIVMAEDRNTYTELLLHPDAMGSDTVQYLPIEERLDVLLSRVREAEATA